MKKCRMNKIALLGLTSGLLFSAQGHAIEKSESPSDETLLSASCSARKSGCNGQRASCSNQRASCNGQRASCNGQRGYTASRDRNTSMNETAEQDDFSTSSQSNMNENELFSQLNERGRALYESLDSEGRAMALKLANRSCKANNECKGQGACSTAKNSCMGKNDCRGQSKCKFADKNDAVKVAAQKMAEKRNKTSESKY